MSEDSADVGLDVHKDSIAVAIARPGATRVAGNDCALSARTFAPESRWLALSFCDEVGSCGEGLDREIMINHRILAG